MRKPAIWHGKVFSLEELFSEKQGCSFCCYVPQVALLHCITNTNRLAKQYITPPEGNWHELTFVSCYKIQHLCTVYYCAPSRNRAQPILVGMKHMEYELAATVLFLGGRFCGEHLHYLPLNPCTVRIVTWKSSSLSWQKNWWQATVHGSAQPSLRWKSALLHGLWCKGSCFLYVNPNFHQFHTRH